MGLDIFKESEVENEVCVECAWSVELLDGRNE